MKRTLTLLLVLISFQSISQRKIGLIVAVGEYPAIGRWKNLSSINDVRYLKAALFQNGFAEKDIDTVMNKMATKAGILKALDNLIIRAQPGDIVLFHFSGHGQQIMDDNQDEADGYDEALIPYDAFAMYDPVDYKGEKHLRDDELGEKLGLLRAKIGASGSLVVMIDACHSGTATRGVNDNQQAGFVARGSSKAFERPGYVPNTRISFASANTNSGEFFGSSDLGNMIAISASSPNQVNFETRDQYGLGVGSLSYAFFRAVSELKPGSTYGYLFEKIRAYIQSKFPGQVPMIEGNVNQELFGGKYIVPESYTALHQWVNDTTFSISKGLLSGLVRGAKLKIYALNDKDETMPLAEGYLSLVGSFQSIGVVNKALPRGEAYRVKVEEANYGDFAASLLFRSNDPKAKQPSALIRQMTKFIEPYQYLSISNSPDYIFDIQQLKTGESSISMIDRSDSTRWSVRVKKGDTLSKDDLAKMLDNLKRAMRINYLRTMPDGGTLAQNVIVEIIPVQNTGTANQDIVFKPLDAFNIKITNNSPYDLYFSLIDLLPDNEVKVLIPYDGQVPGDYFIQSKSTRTIGEIEVDPGTPSGMEFMKFIFTKTPMDLRPVFARSQTRGTPTRGGFEGVLDDMFKDNNEGQATRSTMRSVKIDEVGVVTKAFTIKH